MFSRVKRRSNEEERELFGGSRGLGGSGSFRFGGWGAKSSGI